MPIRPRDEIERIPAVPHGGFHSARPHDLIDYSSNVNPYGPSPRIWDAMRVVPIQRHPDPRALPLRTFLAETLGVAREHVVTGNGTAELIYALAVAYLRPGDRVLVIGPTFGEYAAAAQMMGAEVARRQATADAGFRVDGDALVDEAVRTRPRFIHICNPNNPTGAYVGRELIERLLSQCPDSLVVLDEAFIQFAAPAWDARPLLAHENLVLLRSMTKDYALTGLRAGYALASPEMVAALDKVMPPWSVNSLAQAAAMAAVADTEHLKASLAAIARSKEGLVADLERLGYRPVPSAVHFFLVPVPSAAQMAQQLAARRILVRDCTSFGLPGHIRIATQKPDENARLVAALGELG